MAVSKPHPWAYRAYRWFWAGVDWVFPPRCVGCGKPGERFCATCLAAVQKVPRPLCLRCGMPLRHEAEVDAGLCFQCGHAPPAFARARSWAVMAGSVREAIHRLKYHQDWALADVLAAELLALVEAQGWQVDAVVPVPLGERRLRERGYNQAALLAFPLALGLGVAYRPRWLQRVRETRSQVGLSAAERRANVEGAFGALPDVARGLTVLLVDDVMTTGATMHAAAQALRAAGARRVYAVSVARAVLRKISGWSVASLSGR